jgi:trehalose/maltose hydrolase-like predicted phosphorylase
MKYLGVLISVFLSMQLYSQSTWEIPAKDIDPNNYFGITCANGVVGLVSSPNPMEVQDVVLNGVYDYYQRGRVSNILKTFNHVNMYLDVDGARASRANISNYAQTLDMKRAILTTTFEVAGKVKVKHELMALRHLPYSALSVVEIEALADVDVQPYSVIACALITSTMCATFSIR